MHYIAVTLLVEARPHHQGWPANDRYPQFVSFFCHNNFLSAMNVVNECNPKHFPQSFFQEC
jgi:hypothetical protein